MRLIGLTGGPKTGITTVGRMFNSIYQIPVISVNEILEEVKKRGAINFGHIPLSGGQKILKSDGTINEEYLARKLSGYRINRFNLYDIVSNGISDWLSERLERLEDQGNKIVLIENNQLFESRIYGRYDAILVVASSIENQIARLMQDGHSENESKIIIDQTLNLTEKIKKSNFLIRNDHDLKYLELQVVQVREKMLEIWGE